MTFCRRLRNRSANDSDGPQVRRGECACRRSQSGEPLSYAKRMSPLPPTCTTWGVCPGGLARPSRPSSVRSIVIEASGVLIISQIRLQDGGCCFRCCGPEVSCISASTARPGEANSAARAYLAKGRSSDCGQIRRSARRYPEHADALVAIAPTISARADAHDLLFHVQEHQLTIPEIESFLRQHNLQFIGFELAPAVSASYRFQFPEDRAMSNLASWHIFEKENPRTFAGMYQFWNFKGNRI